MDESDNRDELSVDHFGMGTLGLTYTEAEYLHSQSEQSEPRGICRHFGETLETRTCEGCGGKRIAIHACAIHMECTLQLNRDGVKFCGACRDFTAKPSA